MIVKKYLMAVVSGLAFVSGVQAQQVTEAQALERAHEFFSSEAAGKAGGTHHVRKGVRQLTLAFRGDSGAGQQEASPYYVFNAGDNGGFVIVSGDGRMGDILGYSAEGSFDPGQLPANMRAWLKGYEESIRALSAPVPEEASDGATSFLAGQALQGKAAVAPLIKTKWSQGWPYNLLTPEESGQHCVTGCVATSMAMVMNYWKYPTATVKDIPAWSGLGKVPAGTRIDWANMSEYYGNSEWWSYFADVEDTYCNELYPETTVAQQQAVAALMKMCGMAVNMDYGLEESKAQDIAPLSALKDYFGYKNEMKFLLQDNYTIANWEAVIYNELAQKRPVMYGGIADDFGFSGGHSFLVDGYDGNGFFHINWGVQSGLLNGYYTLSAQRFYKQTSAIVGIQPTAGGSIADVPTVGAYTSDANVLTLTAVTTDGPVWAIDTYPGCGNIILTLKNNGGKLFKGLVYVGATDEAGLTAWDNVMAEVPANGSAQVLVPYYEFQLEHGKNIIRVADFATSELISGEFTINVERRRIPNLDIAYTLDGVDAVGLIKYGTPCTLRYKITSQWGGDPTLKARLRITGLPSGEEMVRELGTITYGKAIEGSVKVDAPSWEPLPDYCDFTITPQVEFYTDTRSNEYMKHFFQNGTQEGDSRTIVFCRKKPHFATKAVKADMEQLTGFNSDISLRPAGYYVFGHYGFVGFENMYLKDDLPSFYEYGKERAWQDYQEGVTYYTGILQCGSSTKKNLAVFDCPSDKPYAAGSIEKKLGGKTVYFPCNEAGMKEAAGRGLYKNELGAFLPEETVLRLLYSGGGATANDFFADCYLYYYPVVEGVDGDVNGDGTVDVADIAAVISVMAGSTAPQSGSAPNPQSGSAPNPADVNGDGAVDVADIATIISIMAKSR